MKTPLEHHGNVLSASYMPGPPLGNDCVIHCSVLSSPLLIDEPCDCQWLGRDSGSSEDDCRSESQLLPLLTEQRAGILKSIFAEQ
jgi:hypothetical protein